MISSQLFSLKIFAHTEMRDLNGEDEVLRNPVFYNHGELSKKRFSPSGPSGRALSLV